MASVEVIDQNGKRFSIPENSLALFPNLKRADAKPAKRDKYVAVEQPPTEETEAPAHGDTEKDSDS